MIKQSRKASKVQKVVQVVARYFIKRNGHVVYAVRPSQGGEPYYTTLINGKATGCTCPVRGGHCYHRDQLEQIEAMRAAIPVLAGWMSGFAVAAQTPDEPARTGVYAERLQAWARSNAADAYEVLAATKHLQGQQEATAESCCKCGQRCRNGICAACAGA